ncbi:MAG: hypothetical protein AB1374_06265 [Bacillota bacterium]
MPASFIKLGRSAISKTLFLVFCALICALFGSGGEAAEADKGRVVILIIDRLSLDDLENPAWENLSRLISMGGAGLLNTATGGIRNPENTYATIGAGAHAIATNAGNLAYETDERLQQGVKAGEEFKQRTGIAVMPGNVVVLEMPHLNRENAALNYPVQPGALGEELKTAGLTAACLGNADWREQTARQVATVAMDRRGLVSSGYVGRELVMRDSLFPGSFRSDYDILWNKWLSLTDSDFLVIDLGDTSRLDEAQTQITDVVFSRRWNETLERADRFLGKVSAALDLQRDLLIVVSPTPSKNALRSGDWFTPVIMVGRGVQPGTVLTSPSTRRPGIVMNTDLAPTVLKHFGISTPNTMSGRPVATAEVRDQLSHLKLLREKVVFVHNFRTPVIKGYLIYTIILISAAVLLILLREHRWARTLWARQFVISIMGVPLAALIMPVLGTRSPILYLAGIIVITIALTMLTLHLEERRTLAGFVFLSVATVGLIIADVLFGGTLMKQSILSYDAMSGARFYGIGNEYMGVLISATIFSSACVLSIWPSRLSKIGTALLGLAVIMALGAPGLGANFGGLLTACVAFPVTFLAFAGVRFQMRHMALVIAVLVSLPLIFVAVDLFRQSGVQSHMGRNLLLVLQDPSAAFDIIKRKMAMNIKLFKYTIWSRVLAAGIGGLLLLSYRPVGVMRVLRSRYPYLFTGFLGVVVTAVAAFIFNDSGTVAAATATIFGIPPLLYILSGE